jgi:hypothetical protein
MSGFATRGLPGFHQWRRGQRPIESGRGAINRPGVIAQTVAVIVRRIDGFVLFIARHAI